MLDDAGFEAIKLRRKLAPVFAATVERLRLTDSEAASVIAQYVYCLNTESASRRREAVRIRAERGDGS